MAGYLKKVFIIGNLGRDPEMRFLQDGTPVASFTVAVNDRARRGPGDGQQGGSAPQGAGGQGEETTTWFRVTAWRRQAEIVSQYLTKGSSVFVSGDLTMREFTGNDGQKRTTLEVNMQDMQILTPKGGQEQGGFSGGAPTTSARPSTGNAPASGGFDDDSDIPF